MEGAVNGYTAPGWEMSGGGVGDATMQWTYCHLTLHLQAEWSMGSVGGSCTSAEPLGMECVRRGIHSRRVASEDSEGEEG